MHQKDNETYDNMITVLFHYNTKYAYLKYNEYMYHKITHKHLG